MALYNCQNKNGGGDIAVNLSDYTAPEIVSDRYTNLVGGYKISGKRVEIFILAKLNIDLNAPASQGNYFKPNLGLDSFIVPFKPANNEAVSLQGTILKQDAYRRKYFHEICFPYIYPNVDASINKSWITLGAQEAISRGSDSYYVLIQGFFFKN